MRIVIERDVEKYQDALWDLKWNLLRPIVKYENLSEETAEVVGRIWEGFHDLIEEHKIDINDL